MPRLLVSTESTAIKDTVASLCASIGWQETHGPLDLTAPDTVARSGADALLLDLGDSNREIQDSLQRLADAYPFFPVILMSPGRQVAADQGSSVLYHLNSEQIEDLEHILISLSCAGFSQEDRPAETKTEPAPSQPRVLVVDDDVRLNAAMAQALRATDQFHVRAVHSGFQAGAILPEFRPHLVIVDISLGDMDGREVCAFIRRHATLANTKVIGVSGYVPTSVVEETENIFDGFLEKPFLLKELVSRVKACLGPDWAR